MNKIHKDIALNMQKANTHLYFPIFGEPRSQDPQKETWAKTASISRDVVLLSKHGGPKERGFDDSFTIGFGAKTSRSWATKNADKMLRRLGLHWIVFRLTAYYLSCCTSSLVISRHFSSTAKDVKGPTLLLFDQEVIKYEFTDISLEDRIYLGNFLREIVSFKGD